jgi:hypothetical protein
MLVLMYEALTWHVSNLFRVDICRMEDASLFKTGDASRFL